MLLPRQTRSPLLRGTPDRDEPYSGLDNDWKEIEARRKGTRAFQADRLQRDAGGLLSEPTSRVHREEEENVWVFSINVFGLIRGGKRL